MKNLTFAAHPAKGLYEVEQWLADRAHIRQQADGGSKDEKKRTELKALYREVEQR